MHAEAGDAIAQRAVQRLGSRIASKHIESNASETHSFSELFHLKQGRPTETLAPVLWENEELEDVGHANIASGQAAKPNKA